MSNELGAGHPKSAAFSVVIVTLSSSVIAVICAILVLVLRHVISYAFTSGSTVADAVSELSPFLAISIILNGIQPVLSGKNFGLSNNKLLVTSTLPLILDFLVFDNDVILYFFR